MSDDVTLDDVARRSGVSRATASRALNHRQGVRPDVRERVQTIATALGYRPNRSARNLAGGRASVIGLVVGESEIRDKPYATALIQSVAKAAGENDEGLLLVMETAEPSETIRNLLRDNLVDGIIVSIVAAGSPWVGELLDARLPTIMIGSTTTPGSVPSIDVENLESSAELVGHVLDSGCTRLGAITGYLERSDAAQRLEGFRLAHKRRSIEVDESLIKTGNFSRACGYEFADVLFDDSVDGIVCANDDSARGVHLRAMERGIRIPEDISLVGFDGTAIDEFGSLRLTSVMQPFDRMAQLAVKSLVAAIDGVAPPNMQIVEPELFFGETTRPFAPVSSPAAVDEEGLSEV